LTSISPRTVTIYSGNSSNAWADDALMWILRANVNKRATILTDYWGVFSYVLHLIPCGTPCSLCPQRGNT
jgi:hypothetical protein